MMRNFTLIALLVFSSFLAKAQLPDGSIAPNFTATDINGNTHTLYDILDQGKSVVIDFMATWCGPCWSYHQTHATSDLYELYGPNGTDEVVVFMIESDSDTNLDCLFGTSNCNDVTLGNWTEGVEYPIFNDHTIAPLFSVQYYPTIYHICPNRIIREAGQVQVDDLYEQNEYCLYPFGNVNAGILQYNGFQGAFCGEETFAPSVQFQNIGQTNMTSANFELSLNGNVVETIDWAGNLATYGYSNIEFSNVTVSSATVLEVNITSVNGGSDDDVSNNLVTVDIPLAPVVADSVVTLEILTDEWPNETSWDLRDATGTTIASGGGYADELTVYSEEIVLSSEGCFDFTINDSYGDGICCNYGEGYFKLMDGDGNIIFEGGEFGDFHTEPFLRGENPTAVRELVSVTGLNLFPNPVRSELNISFNVTENTPLKVTVFNTLGQQVEALASQDFTVGQHTLNMDVSTFNNGVYYVRFTNGEKQLTSKFTVIN